MYFIILGIYTVDQHYFIQQQCQVEDKKDHSLEQKKDLLKVEIQKEIKELDKNQFISQIVKHPSQNKLKVINQDKTRKNFLIKNYGKLQPLALKNHLSDMSQSVGNQQAPQQQYTLNSLQLKNTQILQRQDTTPKESLMNQFKQKKQLFISEQQIQYYSQSLTAFDNMRKSPIGNMGFRSNDMSINQKHKKLDSLAKINNFLS